MPKPIQYFTTIHSDTGSLPKEKTCNCYTLSFSIKGGGALIDGQCPSFEGLVDIYIYI